MRIGLVILPDTSWHKASERWRIADELGFHHAWTYDHLTWRERAGAAWYAAVPTLAAAAVHTSRIRLGTLVASPHFRHPAALAHEFMTLDNLAGGRMILGVGAGTLGIDAAALTRSPLCGRERMERFAEFTRLLDRLLADGHATHYGKHYWCESVRLVPGCGQRPRPPIAVAANGPKGMEVVANCAEMWITNGYVPAPHEPPRVDDVVLRRQSAALDAACQENGRDPSDLSRVMVDTSRDRPPLASASSFAAAIERYSALGFTDLVVPFPAPDGPYRGDRAVLEEVADRFLRANGQQGERPCAA